MLVTEYLMLAILLIAFIMDAFALVVLRYGMFELFDRMAYCLETDFRQHRLANAVQMIADRDFR